MRRLLVHVVLRRQQALTVSRAGGAAIMAGCDRPLIEALEQGPALPCALHLPGHVLEWLDGSDSGLIDRLSQLVSNDQMELLGGGFYSPALSVLPWRDAIGQLEMMSGYLERRTGRRPQGVWLERGTWTPRLAEVLADGGARYTLLPGPQVRAAGVPAGPLAACYATEHVGRPLAILPTHTQLSALAHGPVAVLIEALRKAHGAGEEAATLVLDLSQLADVGEHVAALAQGLAAASELIEVRLPADTVATAAVRARLYVPDDAGHAAGGGLWQRWLGADGHADRMHKRMIEVSRRFAALERVIRNQGWRAMSQLTRPRRALYRAQNAQAYVGDEADGLHDPKLRDLVYRNLIEAEAAADQMVRGDKPYLEVSLRDLYAGLDTDILLRNRHLRAVFRPARGGSMAEFEHLPSRTAVLNVLSPPVQATPSPRDAPPHHDRGAFHVRFLHPQTPTERWLAGDAELGDLLAAPHRLIALDSLGRGANERARLSLVAEGGIRCGTQTIDASLIKEVAVGAQDPALSVHLTLSLGAPLPEALHWCLEFNLNPVVHADAGALLLHRPGATAQSLAVPGRAPAADGFTLAGEAPRPRLELRSDVSVGVDWAPLLLAVAAADEPARWQGVAILLRRLLPAGAVRFEWTLQLSCAVEGGMRWRLEG